MYDPQKYRKDGATGALLDEYEKSLYELYSVIKDISSNQLEQVVDSETNDEDCRSIQTILSHIIQSGYNYIVEIRKWLGEDIQYYGKVILNSVKEYRNALIKMFQYNKQLFEDHPNILLCEHDSDKKIVVRWGQKYDVEQLLEHAIVHVLRHRRQIEIFMFKLKKTIIQDRE